MTSARETVNEDDVPFIFAQETLLLLGFTLGSLALILSTVTLALIVLKHVSPRPVRSRSTRVSGDSRSEP